jgi:hypothetical protein
MESPSFTFWIFGFSKFQKSQENSKNPEIPKKSQICLFPLAVQFFNIYILFP